MFCIILYYLDVFCYYYFEVFIFGGVDIISFDITYMFIYAQSLDIWYLNIQDTITCVCHINVMLHS